MSRNNRFLGAGLAIVVLSLIFLELNQASTPRKSFNFGPFETSDAAIGTKLLKSRVLAVQSKHTAK